MIVQSWISQKSKNGQLSTKDLADAWIARNNFEYRKDKLQESDYETKYMEAMKNAYRLMNEMGEMLRGKPITYSIVLSSGTKNFSKEQYDGLNIDDFLDLTTFSRNSVGGLGRTLRLANKTTVLQKMKEKQIKGTKWSETKTTWYKGFRDAVKKLNNNQWEEVNEGNITEAFLRQLKYGGTALSNMQKTMSAPAAFWQGGDLEEWWDPFGIQIKTNDATVTNVNSMISQLVKLDNQILKLDHFLQDPQQQERYMEQMSGKQPMDAAFQEAIDGLVLNFLQGTTKEKNAYFQSNVSQSGDTWTSSYG